jgi:hypothetical protein
MRQQEGQNAFARMEDDREKKKEKERQGINVKYVCNYVFNSGH